MPANPLGNTSEEVKAFRSRAVSELPRLLALPSEKTPLDLKTLSTHTRKGVRIEEIALNSEPSVRVTGWILKPDQGSGPLPAILHVSERGKYDTPEETGDLVRLAGKGFLVCSVDLRGLGFSIPRLPSAGPVFYHDDNMQEDYAWASFSLGKPVLGQRVWDCLRSLEYLKSRPDVARDRIYGLGDGGAAIALLMAGVLDTNLHSLMLDSSLATYRSLVESEAYSLQLPWFLYGILQHFDLPDLVGAMAPRSCWLANSTDAMGTALPESNLASIFRHSIAAYKGSGAGKGLRLSVCPDQLKQKMLDKWLEST